MKIPCIVLGGMLTAAGGAMAAEPQAVLSQMNEVNLMEMRMGQLAGERGGDAQVRDFGDRLYRDHRYLNDEVQKLAAALGVTLLAQPPNTPEEQAEQLRHQEIGRRLETLQGSEFDSLFLTFMQDTHRAAIETLTQARPKLTDDDLVELVERTLPILEQHLALAVALTPSAAPIAQR